MFRIRTIYVGDPTSSSTDPILGTGKHKLTETEFLESIALRMDVGVAAGAAPEVPSILIFLKTILCLRK